MRINQKQWLNEKITLRLTRHEFYDIAYVFATADNNDAQYFSIKDKKIRRIFKSNFERRHELWKKLVNV